MKRYSSLLLLLFVVLTTKAGPVDPNAAREVGAKFLHAKALLKTNNPTELQWAATYRTSNDDTAFYVYNSTNGFVIVSADDCYAPIIGYSNKGIFTRDDVPVQMEEYLQNFVKQIQYGIENRISADEATVRQWEWVRSTGRLSEKKGASEVEPLLTDIWRQGCYYNELCPADTNGQCGHVLVGCVATSMAQILHYWGYPETGSGSFTYTPTGYPQQSVDFGATTYQWDNMPDSLTAASTAAQIDAVATLMWHCGVAVQMEYSPTGSGAIFLLSVSALEDHFNYSSNMSTEYRDSHSTEEWLTLIKNSLDWGRPIHYCGGDHAFVCDGYDDNDFLHFNWGWGGRYDGYFADGALNPFTYNFNTNNIAIINIHPGNFTYEVNISANPSEGGTVSFGDKDDSATFAEGESCTVIAIPNSGYGFTCWTEDGDTVSTSSNYTFFVNDNRNLVANFAEGLVQQYSVTVSANPDIGGTVSFDNKDTREVYLYDFEDGTMMGWTSLDADGDGYDWVSSTKPSQYFNWGVNLTGYGHNASQSFVMSGSFTNSALTALTPDNYLISPTKGKYHQITFYAAAQDNLFAADHFGVAVSTTNATPESFTTLQEWTMTHKSKGQWYQYTVDLSAYSGQEIWVAIRHFDCTQQFVLKVDDIVLSTGLSATYDQDQPCTLTATANQHYIFVNWTKGDEVVSDEIPFNFLVTEDGHYTANFELQTYTVDIEVDPPGAGVVTGDTIYSYGERATVSVDPNENYHFTRWTENGEMVSLSNRFSFVVKENHHLVVHLAQDNALSEQNDAKIEVFPNPANNKLTIKCEEPILRYSIYDITGVLVTQVANFSKNEVEIDIESLAVGVYVIRLAVGNTVLTSRFVKE